MSGASGTTYSIPLLTTTSQVSGSQLSISPTVSGSVGVVSPPMLPTVSGSASLVSPPMLPTVSGSLDPMSVLRSESGSLDLMPSMYIDPSAPIEGPTSPLSDPIDDMEPEEVMVQTYKLLRSLNGKIDAMIGQQNRVANSILGIDRRVGDSSSVLRELGSGVETIDTKLTNIKGSMAPTNGENEENAENEEENTEENEEENTEENAENEEENAENEEENAENEEQEGGARGRVRRSRKARRTKKRSTRKPKHRK